MEAGQGLAGALIASSAWTLSHRMPLGFRHEIATDTLAALSASRDRLTPALETANTQLATAQEELREQEKSLALAELAGTTAQVNGVVWSLIVTSEVPVLEAELAPRIADSLTLVDTAGD